MHATPTLKLDISYEFPPAEFPHAEFLHALAGGMTTKNPVYRIKKTG